MTGATVALGALLSARDRLPLEFAQTLGRVGAVLQAQQLTGALQLDDQPVGLCGPADTGG